MYVENKFNKDIRLTTTLAEPSYRNTIIKALKMTSLRFNTTSQEPVIIVVYDSTTGERIKINNQDYVSITPSRQTATPTTLTITSVGMVLNKYVFIYNYLVSPTILYNIEPADLQQVSPITAIP